MKGEVIRFLRSNTDAHTYYNTISTFRKHLLRRNYPRRFVDSILRNITQGRRSRCGRCGGHQTKVFGQKQGGVWRKRMTQSWSAAVHPEPRLRRRAPWPSSLKAFHFLKRQFGSKDEERSFRAEWCDCQVLLLYILISSLSTSYILNYGVAEPRL